MHIVNVVGLVIGGGLFVVALGICGQAWAAWQAHKRGE